MKEILLWVDLRNLSHSICVFAMNFIGKIKKKEEERRNSDLFTWDVVVQNSERYFWQLKTIQKQNFCKKSQEEKLKSHWARFDVYTFLSESIAYI